MVQEVKDAIQVLKHIKSLKGDYKGYAEHANSRDIHIIGRCCYNLLKDNIPLYASQKKKIKIFLKPIEKEMNIIGNKKASVKTKREILSDPQFGDCIFTLLAAAILPALVSALAREKPNGIDEAGSSGSGVCEKVGKHKEVECKICLKTMTSNNLKRHMKTHENKPCSIDVITEDDPTIDVVSLKNNIKEGVKEYKRKLEYGREIKKILHKLNAPTACLDKDNKEALEFFEKHGQEKEIEAVEWRPWQMDILDYVNDPTNRGIIWIVGEKGNEGKTFFSHKIEEQYGVLRVFQMELDESARDILHIMKKYVYIETDIFLFDIPRSMCLSREHYELFDSIKYGSATAMNYKTVNMRFTTPNVVMVFSPHEPDRENLSGDKWTILKISEDLTGLTDITNLVKNNNKKIENESDDKVTTKTYN